MHVGSRVALEAARDFTGEVESVDGDLFTVVFDVGGRGWLTAAHLVDLKPITEGTESMNEIHKDDQVSLREFPGITGTVVGVSGSTAVVREDETNARVTREVADLRKIDDVPLLAAQDFTGPRDDKAWPPSGLENKDQGT